MKLPGNKNVFVDGGSTTVKQVAKYRIVPLLKAEGVATIDYQFVTHGDLDHLSGVKEMLSDNNMQIRIKNLVVPYMREEDDTLKELIRLALRRNVKVFRISVGKKLSIEGCNITCINPSKNASWDDKNDYSTVLSVVFGKFSMLLTGDLTSNVEPEVMKYISKSYTVLKVGHHGSKYSSSDDFLKCVSPKFSVISVGAGNRYGHPAREVLQRLTNCGSKYMRTDQKGGITITTDGKKLNIFSKSVN